MTEAPQNQPEDLREPDTTDPAPAPTYPDADPAPYAGPYKDDTSDGTTAAAPQDPAADSVADDGVAEEVGDHSDPNAQ